ncbi:MAG: 30S ribosomal protein S12 methylthiotransferase RimO [Cardiobacteriaceae bacterium]|nr:30S ribosomal protein S12 methylthiotransferase RimO [Cardiobacteriaceae bacterium]
MSKQPAVGFISLGCPKALVDSERILTQVSADGYRITADYQDADVVVVNTCGFINAAVEESMDAINEAMCENGKVIVTGCMGNKPEEILARYPDVLAITGAQKYEEVMQAIHKAVPKPNKNPHLDLIPDCGLKLTPRHYAYLKISEGCDHKCSFCIIPDLRGKLESRSISKILREAAGLKKSGVQEILLVAQDTAAYGADLHYAEDTFRGKKYRQDLLTLLEELSQLEIWIRLHYLYPYPIIEPLVEMMAAGKILPYLDIPFQHASDRILRAMRRPGNIEKSVERIANWRKICPDLCIRSTFIVGFPGETEDDFAALLDFIETAKINRAGCFAYSAIDGAAANRLENQIPEEIKEERREIFMQKQAEISRELLEEKIGAVLPVIIDEVDVENQSAIGRTAYDAPEIDGIVHIDGIEGVASGEIVNIEIEDSDEHDLYGKVF